MSFWWDGMTKYITKMLKSCRTCQLAKHHSALSNTPTASRRWQRRFSSIQLDFAGPFHKEAALEPSPWGAEYLCVMICECTNMSLVVPTRSTSSRDVIGALTIWISTYGVPRILQLDACPSHNSQSLRTFTAALGCRLKLGIPRRPQCQGKVERFIRDLKEAVRIGTQQKP
ncbi:retrovirus polyprotein, putative, partial [Perkinsus marinus ATCC 50983]